MGALFKMILVLYLLSLIFSLFVGLCRFLVDVAKWHDREKKVRITKSIERGDINGRNDNSDRGTGNNYSGTESGTGAESGTGTESGAESGRTVIQF